MRYGRLGKPSLLVIGSRFLMALGVEYEGGITARLEVDCGTKQMSSMNFLNESRCWVKNEFIGSIHDSLVPKVAILAIVIKDFATRVRVRFARGFGSAVCVSALRRTARARSYLSAGQIGWDSIWPGRRSAETGTQTHCCSLHFEESRRNGPRRKLLCV